jgi:hypothetical protein
MTSPMFKIPLDDFEDASESSEEANAEVQRFPKIMLPWPKEDLSELSSWLDNWIMDLKSAHAEKIDQWGQEEVAYRALDLGPQQEPFVGAPGHVVPLIAMAVDPIMARLDTGIFKASPVFQFKFLRKNFLKYTDAVVQWVEYYQKHQMKLRKTMSPRLLELTKHGTMVLKVAQHREIQNAKVYDDDWQVVEKTSETFFGPQIFGVGIKDFMFPPHYQDLQECPIVVERHRVTWEQIKKQELAGKLGNTEAIKGMQSSHALNELEITRAESSNYTDPGNANRFYEIYEIWADYLYQGKEYKLCVMYHFDTHTILSLRLNFYFHQKKPYVLIPYTVTNDSLWGIGICEMVLAFQQMLTQWDRSAMANAMLANIRMLIARKDSDIEARPKFFTGRVFRVEDPSKDLIPFNAAADIYPSTLMERQNIIGLAEKRTGVSDYLTGRESPIVGSRATATSTMALIQEGTKRVEETLENVRNGMAEAMEMCMSLWIQYGLGDIKDIVFGGDDISDLLVEFFDQIDQDNINGAVAIDLSATDAGNNRSVQQQTQLAIIQVLMNYLERLIKAGQLAVQSSMQTPQLSQLIGETMTAARKMFLELLVRYDIRNPEEYLPDLQQFLEGIGVGTEGGNPTGPTPPIPQPGVQAVPGPSLVPPGAGPTGPMPGTPGPAAPPIPGQGAGV